MPVVVSDLLPQPKVVPVSGQDLQVVGLTLDDITAILNKHQDKLLAFFAASDAGMLQQLLVASPAMVADIIAIGIDARGQEDDIRKLPFVAQAEILAAIWELSVPDLKKFMGVVESLTQSLQQLGDEQKVEQTKIETPKKTSRAPLSPSSSASRKQDSASAKSGA